MPISPSARVRASARLMSRLPRAHVRVDAVACTSAAHFLHAKLLRTPATLSSIAASWRGANGLHPAYPSLEALNWIFVVDTLNFCFWGARGEERFAVQWRGIAYAGYWALCAAVNRAIDEGIPITDPEYYATVDACALAHVFRSANGTSIHMLEERVCVLKEAGEVLVDKFGGSVAMLVASCDGSAQRLVETVVTQFESYDDSVPLKALGIKQGYLDDGSVDDGRICLYKRAQILVADIWACFADTEKHKFHDISSLTMFADYRVPQILAWLGAIKYSESLLTTLKLGDEMRSGSREEVEIRSCSIQAVEIIREELAKLQADDNMSGTCSHSPVSLNSILVDFALWDYATEHRKELAEIPIHRVKSIFY